MTEKDFRDLILRMDPVNAEYIMADSLFRNKFNEINRYKKKGEYEIMEMCEWELQEMARDYNGKHLTPANVKVGDGATILLWSDRHAATIIKTTNKTVTVQRDKATLDPDFKPKFEIGGFAAHCKNQNEQTYTYERDELGDISIFRWSEKHRQYRQPGNITLIKGRHEFYDHNF